MADHQLSPPQPVVASSEAANLASGDHQQTAGFEQIPTQREIRYGLAKMFEDVGHHDQVVKPLAVRKRREHAIVYRETSAFHLRRELWGGLDAHDVPSVLNGT